MGFDGGPWAPSGKGGPWDYDGAWDGMLGKGAAVPVGKGVPVATRGPPAPVVYRPGVARPPAAVGRPAGKAVVVPATQPAKPRPVVIPRPIRPVGSKLPSEAAAAKGTVAQVSAETAVEYRNRVRRDIKENAIEESFADFMAEIE